MSGLETRLQRLEAAAGGAEEEARALVVVLQLFDHDGTALDAPPVPEGVDVLIRRQIVRTDGRGSVAPGYVPIRGAL